MKILSNAKDISLQNLSTSKIEVRAQNFRKFREATSDLVKSLFDTQLKAKKAIISDLEDQLISTHN